MFLIPIQFCSCRPCLRGTALLEPVLAVLGQRTCKQLTHKPSMFALLAHSWGPEESFQQGRLAQCQCALQGNHFQFLELCSQKEKLQPSRRLQLLSFELLWYLVNLIVLFFEGIWIITQILGQPYRKILFSDF